MATREDRECNFLNSEALDDEFFIDVVSKKLNLPKEQFKVRLVFVSPATGKNENYISAVYRCKINIELLETKERLFVDVILKAMLTNIPEFEEFNIFKRETLLYDNIIPSLEGIWKETAGREVKFGPACLKVTSTPYEMLVLDDLKAEGYQMLDRKQGLDVNQTKLVLSKLAEFHAASTIRYQQDGPISDDLDRMCGVDAFLVIDSDFHKGYIKGLNEFRRVIEEIGGLDNELAIISKWKPEALFKSFIIPDKPMKCGFKVLNHGDDWLNNMMFKLDENGEATAVKLIDFQISFWGTPVADLYYLLLSSVSDEVKVEHFDDFIEHYHSELSDFLKQVSYDGHIPTLCELQLELIEKRQYGVSMMLDILTVVKYNSPEEFTVEQMLSVDGMDQASYDRVFRNEYYKNAIQKWLPFLHKRGLLDPVEGEEV